MNAKAAAALLAAAVTTAGPAHAQDEVGQCRNGLYEEPEIGRAAVTSRTAVTLETDFDGCPAETAKCRGPIRIQPGAVLLTGHRLGAYVCAVDPASDDVGFVTAARLKALPVDPSPTLRAWVGRWRDGDNTIRLSVKGGALVADGQAYWPSAHPSPRQFPGGPNLGDLGGTATPHGGEVVFADEGDDACRATLRLIGDALVVADNHNCGGMNVSFTGAYRRR